jgi:P-type Cu+ transporter
MDIQVSEKVSCFHCGDTCVEEIHTIEDKHFCCKGCQTVYEILNENELCGYYDLNEHAGQSLKAKNFGGRFDFLLETSIEAELLDFKNEEIAKVIFFIPAIHCSSCVWLLENFHKIKAGVVSSRLNFIKKELAITYHPKIIGLKDIVELLATLGYEPQISLGDSLEKGKKVDPEARKLLLKIGLVGFCAGNIMLMSFPEYFKLNPSNTSDVFYQRFFLYFNFVLSLPVFFYGASDYLKGACRSIVENLNKNSQVLSVDIPIALGIAALFFRSTFETLVNHKAGYWDSLAGLVLFLLVGKWVQQTTFSYLSFDRSYKSYFPLAVKVENGSFKNVKNLEKADVYFVHHQELIPADSKLLEGRAWIDYSFVTGESRPVEVATGQLIFAGGRQMADMIRLEVQKPVSTSYLTQLWNNESFSKEKETPTTKLANAFSKYFSIFTICLSVCTGLYWQFVDPAMVWPTFTAVLMVACPCALTLSLPFAMNTAMSLFAKNKFYVKNQGVIQLLAETDTFVFDKTGTLTESSQGKVSFVGPSLSYFQKQLVVSLARQSVHPLSQLISSSFSEIEGFPTTSFVEIKGQGIRALINGMWVTLGSGNSENISSQHLVGSVVFFAINDVSVGYFWVEPVFRKSWKRVLKTMKSKFEIHLLSGDNASLKKFLEPFFGEQMMFNQKPQDKLDYVKSLGNNRRSVVMIGDGLNDAGALRQSKVGIALTDDIQAFSPSCDAILEASNFEKLPAFVDFSKVAMKIVKASFLLSVVYNLIGLSWAVSGQLSPVVAAIFMPLSSMSVVIFAVGLTLALAKIKKI